MKYSAKKRGPRLRRRPRQGRVFLRRLVSPLMIRQARLRQAASRSLRNGGYFNSSMHTSEGTSRRPLTARNYIHVEIAARRCRIDTGFLRTGEEPGRNPTFMEMLFLTLPTIYVGDDDYGGKFFDLRHANSSASERALAPMNVGADFSIKRVPRRGCSTAYRDQ